MQVLKPQKPSYYIRKKLLSNPGSVFGIIVVCVAILIALLGYLIMPDSTPNANDGNPAIRNKSEGFSVLILKKHRNFEIPHVNFFQKLLFGQESPYTIEPINSYRIDKDSLWVYIKEYYESTSSVAEQNQKEKKYHIVNITLPLFNEKSGKLPDRSPHGNFKLEGDKVIYLTPKEELKTIEKSELLKTFEASNIEKRNYWLGTDKQGRDLLSRLIFGLRISLSIGFLAVLISVIVGIGLGALAGFIGGWVDQVIVWFMTVVWSIPQIMLVIAISLALGKGVWVAFVAVGLTAWVDIARIVRGQILSIKEKQFVEAARAMGAKSSSIITKHIFPNIFGPLIVIISSNFASAILTEAGLSFLGLGAQPPMPSWGKMVYEGRDYIGAESGFHLIFYPSICISVIVLAFNFLGNGLRDAYDPKIITKK